MVLVCLRLERAYLLIYEFMTCRSFLYLSNRSMTFSLLIRTRHMLMYKLNPLVLVSDFPFCMVLLFYLTQLWPRLEKDWSICWIKDSYTGNFVGNPFLAKNPSLSFSILFSCGIQIFLSNFFSNYFIQSNVYLLLGFVVVYAGGLLKEVWPHKTLFSG